MTNQEPKKDKLHQLQLVQIDLVGGGRQVSMFEGINCQRQAKTDPLAAGEN